MFDDTSYTTSKVTISINNKDEGNNEEKLDKIFKEMSHMYSRVFQQYTLKFHIVFQLSLRIPRKLK